MKVGEDDEISQLRLHPDFLGASTFIDFLFPDSQAHSIRTRIPSSSGCCGRQGRQYLIICVPSWNRRPLI